MRLESRNKSRNTTNAALARGGVTRSGVTAPEAGLEPATRGLTVTASLLFALPKVTALHRPTGQAVSASSPRVTLWLSSRPSAHSVEAHNDDHPGRESER